MLTSVFSSAFLKQAAGGGLRRRPDYNADVRKEERKTAVGEWWRRWRKTQLLPKGTTLYHGTGAEFPASELNMPAWFTTSNSVAKHFQQWHSSDEDVPRTIKYKITKPIRLPRIDDKQDMDDFCERFGIDRGLGGSEETCDALRQSALPGWIIPCNYPDGDDILLTSSDSIEPSQDSWTSGHVQRSIVGEQQKDNVAEPYLWKASPRVGQRLVYNDGRPGHTNSVAEILEVTPRSILVQFENRARPSLIFFNDREWMDHITFES